MVISRERMILVGDDANEVLGGCQPIDNDWSIDALVRAIVLKYGNFDVEDLAVNVMVERRRARSRTDMELFLSDTYRTEALTIVECLNCFDENADGSSEWKTEFSFGGKPFPVSQYLSQFGRTKIYLSERQKRLVAFVDRRATNIWVQALESVMCRLMPWYYPADLSEEEQKFYRSIAVDNKAVSAEEKVEIFVRYVNEVAEKINFRDFKLHRLLDGIADRARRTRISSLSTTVSNTRSNITRLMNELARHYESLDANLLELNALENAEPETNNAMFTFFSTHKQVHLLDVYDNELRFGVDDTLEFYDEEEFLRLLGNTRSFVHNYNARTRKALKAIFADKKGVLRVNAVFALQQFKLVNPREGDSFVSEAMPNPHIYFYGCSGGNGQYYSQYANSGDWDLGIEQAISATKNLSWGDSTVCNRMIQWLEGSTVPCVYVAEGLQPIDRVTKEMRLVTFQDFLRMIELTEGDEANG